MVGVGIQNAPLHAHHQFINLIGGNSNKEACRVCVCVCSVYFVENSEDLHIKIHCVCLGMDAEGWGLSYKGILRHNGKSKKYIEPFYEIRNGEKLCLAFSDCNQIK